ncbi:hypothetical protein GUJ93_ZPchr0318g28949 [Zizania palustris]|uniref:Uncharacterized protein n=1 Tax=Zizania palustris TaxID=103762 RepID=A0A8J5R111_ZIZPA|nr:hypothetical protein GUJ93_ZPchr0318g28949 [Zizania palustris]
MQPALASSQCPGTHASNSLLCLHSASPDSIPCSSLKIELDLSPHRNPQINTNHFDLTQVVNSKEPQILDLEVY